LSGVQAFCTLNLEQFEMWFVSESNGKLLLGLQKLYELQI